jgi:hypothetical protein
MMPIVPIRFEGERLSLADLILDLEPSIDGGLHARGLALARLPSSVPAVAGHARTQSNERLMVLDIHDGKAASALSPALRPSHLLPRRLPCARLALGRPPSSRVRQLPERKQPFRPRRVRRRRRHLAIGDVLLLPCRVFQRLLVWERFGRCLRIYRPWPLSPSQPLRLGAWVIQ